MIAIALAACIAAQPGADAGAVFTGVAVVSMETERVTPGQTVVIAGDRIVAIGPDGGVAVPPDARRVDGRGRYLMPGLVDAHVHLADLPWAHSPENFGDGPRYLAAGVTTVINLGGSARELEWRRRIANGELTGPTIYTSGAFVNEPRVATAEAMVREIRGQRRDGFDLIKFHELEDTTRGLSPETYRAMIATARAEQMPLVGHLPVNLGVDEWLRAGQPAAHAGILSNIYFRPTRSFLPAAAVTAAAALALAALAAFTGTPSVGLAALCAWLVVATMSIVIPYGILFDSVGMRGVAVLLCLVFAAAAWRTRHAGAVAAAAVFAAMLAGYWLPMLWRSTESGMVGFAGRVRAAGISVQSTLVVYETLDAGPMARVGDFNRRLIGALHRAGVEIVAGTDTHGIAGVEPGLAMRQELDLLRRSGLTPYETLRAATVNPARFLGKDHEFGTVAVGKRADLLLLDANPLADLRALDALAGVLVRGRFFRQPHL